MIALLLMGCTEPAPAPEPPPPEPPPAEPTPAEEPVEGGTTLEFDPDCTALPPEQCALLVEAAKKRKKLTGTPESTIGGETGGREPIEHPDPLGVLNGEPIWVISSTAGVQLMRKASRGDELRAASSVVAQTEPPFVFAKALDVDDDGLTDVALYSARDEHVHVIRARRADTP